MLVGERGEGERGGEGVGGTRRNVERDYSSKGSRENQSIQWGEERNSRGT